MAAGAPGAFTTVRHHLHLHGQSEAFHRHWTPAEQVLDEDRAEAEVHSPRSPRHQRSKYCSVHLVTHSPVAVLARATATGLIEALVLSGALGPAFEPRGAARGLRGPALKSAVFEEIDLVAGPTKAPCLRLSGLPSASGGPVLLARSRVLVAAIELPWCAALAAGGTAAAELQAASVTTLLELKAAELPGEIVGWQLWRPSGADAGTGSLSGLALRVRDAPGSGGGAAASGGKAAAGAAAAGRGVSAGTTACQVVDLRTVLEAAAKARAGKPAAAKGESPGDSREDYLRHLQAPVLLPKPLFGALSAGMPEAPTAAAVAKAVAAVQSGQVAHLGARQAVLKHLTVQLPKRAGAVRTELASLKREGAQLKDKAAECRRAAEEVQAKQSEIEAQHAQVVERLSAELRLRELDGVAVGELPRLWAQLHELRQAFELLRVAASPQHEVSQHSPKQLDTLEKLQRTWTDTEASRLRAKAEEAEAAVAVLVASQAAASGLRQGAAPAG